MADYILDELIKNINGAVDIIKLLMSNIIPISEKSILGIVLCKIIQYFLQLCVLLYIFVHNDMYIDYRSTLPLC